MLRMSDTLEEWRVIAECDLYEVSSLGRVRRRFPSYAYHPNFGRVILKIPAGKLLRGSLDEQGYRCVALAASGRQIKRRVARLVCIAFHGPPPTSRHEAAHNDGSKDNDRPDNLRWATTAENQADKKLHGTLLRGALMANAKLGEAEVKTIKRRLAAGELGKALAAEFQVSVSTISLINRRKHWSHITV